MPLKRSRFVQVHTASPIQVAPTDLVPFLSVPSPPRRCDPVVLAAALERVHKAGLRHGFVLVAPTFADRDQAWWSALCERIRKEVRVGVVVVGKRAREWPTSEEQRRPGKRCVAAATGVSPKERAGLVEVARGVCTGARTLLAEATATGTPAFQPGRIDGELRDGALRELMAGRYARTLSATAA